MGRKRRPQNLDEFLFGPNYRSRDCKNKRYRNRDCRNRKCYRGNDNDVETIVSPTETVVNHTTNRRTVRRVHPTHVEHVNRNITRVENYYPVTEGSVKNVNVVEEYDCGSDLRNPCCRPVKRRHKCCR